MLYDVTPDHIPYSPAQSEEFFYQLGLIQFGSFSRIKLEPAPSLRKLVKLAVSAEEGTENSRLSKEEIVDVSILPLDHWG